ncbi:MAG: hypothetical protein JNM39_05350 [Bdellovibrionaceae bacterium]|nr:hypothetical protein [Pseudobdellovibrionaceae bacterium]
MVAVLGNTDENVFSVFTDAKLLSRQNLREEGQARNIYEAVFKSDPSAKVLVHAGVTGQPSAASYFF